MREHKLRRTLATGVIFLSVCMMTIGDTPAFAKMLVTLGDLVTLQDEDKTEGDVCRVTAQVTHKSAFRKRMYVVSAINGVGSPGVVVTVPDGVAAEEGDIANIEGKLEKHNGRIAIKACKLDVTGHFDLPDAPMCKFADFRKGMLHARRFAMQGRLHPRAHQYDPETGMTTLVLSYERNRAFVRVPGKVSVEAFSHSDARVEGCVFNMYNADGTIKEVALELSSPESLVLLRPEEFNWRTPALYTLATMLVILIIVLWAVWAKARRERLANDAVAKDRRRMASELHDTIEQHLATAKLYLSGIQDTDGLPEEVREELKLVERVLAHAKVEVRDAVMDLRGESAVSLEEQIARLAHLVPGNAVRVRVRLAKQPATMDGRVLRDVVAIVREAVTNAIKHGKPKNIVIVGDYESKAADTMRYVLRILNDGEKFDGEAASRLASATGHYGLAGMKERARRSALELAFVANDRWCGVKLTTNC